MRSNRNTTVKMSEAIINDISKPTPEQVKEAREAAGITQTACAELFDYSLSGWQKKEYPTSSKSHRTTSLGEYQLLMLFAGIHPDYELVKKLKLNTR